MKNQIRYFQFCTWEKWYPRKEYKSLPWVKVGSRFFEDRKLDACSFTEKACLMWLLCQTAQQNMGDGWVRIDESVMRSCCGLRWVRDAAVILTKYVNLGVLIEESDVSKHGSRSQELRIRERDKNPLNPLSEIRDVRALVAVAVGNKFPLGEKGS